MLHRDTTENHPINHHIDSRPLSPICCAFSDYTGGLRHICGCIGNGGAQVYCWQHVTAWDGCCCCCCCCCRSSIKTLPKRPPLNVCTGQGVGLCPFAASTILSSLLPKFLKSFPPTQILGYDNGVFWWLEKVKTLGLWCKSAKR